MPAKGFAAILAKGELELDLTDSTVATANPTG